VVERIVAYFLFAEDDDPERFYYDLDIHNRRSPSGLIAWTAAMFMGLVAASQLRRLISGDRAGGVLDEKAKERQGRERREYLYVLPAQVVLFVAFYLLTGNLLSYFVFWAMPMVAVGAGLNALRATIEHADPDEPPTNCRSFHSNPIERMIVGPFNFNLHYEHHRFMTVPYYKVNEVNQRVMAANHYANCQIERSYVSRYMGILKKLETRKRPE
jgi:fatty acid desaturase